MTTVPVKDAKNKLTQILHRVEKGEYFEIKRHNKVVAILSPKDAIVKDDARNEFMAGLRKWRNESAELFSNEEIDSIFTSPRKIENLKRADTISKIADSWN
ncbi:MAG: type II toxin-antitoxin system prevent-host-death family antitoxin [Treponema sp.]|nr:type II toxin-antitoxin system prevent-host-death family antitoxin [Candidatus Treponema equifaecale]